MGSRPMKRPSQKCLERTINLLYLIMQGDIAIIGIINIKLFINIAAPIQIPIRNRYFECSIFFALTIDSMHKTSNANKGMSCVAR